jgi:hypothetical protein
MSFGGTVSSLPRERTKIIIFIRAIKSAGAVAIDAEPLQICRHYIDAHQ